MGDCHDISPRCINSSRPLTRCLNAFTFTLTAKMKIHPTLLKKRSIKNLKFLKKAKAKSKTTSTEQQDTEENHASDDQADIIAVPYEATSTAYSSGPINPYEYHRAAPSPSTARMETAPSSVAPSPSATAQPNAPPPKPKRVQNVKKMTSFLRSKKARTESDMESPTALQRIHEPDEEEDDEYESPLAPSSASSPQAQTFTFASSATGSSTSPHTHTHTCTFPPSTLSSDSTFTPLTSRASESSEEDASVLAIKQQMRALKVVDVASTRNALRLAYEARDTGLGTLARLHTQDARLENVELDLQERVGVCVAGERVRRVKNAGKFVQLVNPWFGTRVEGESAGDDSLHETKEKEKEKERHARDRLRRRRWEVALRRKVTVCVAISSEDGKTEMLVERAKYQFEPDSEDEAFEEEIEGNLEALGEVVPALRELAVRVGESVAAVSERVDGMRERMDMEGEGMVRNKYALGRIH
ncbi:Protein transport protein S9 plasma membrane t-SNARE [Didymosphaeria variabile]|uniref:Protein transport protein S9 plasma membrane t-SNARE n=1 Tax=Didymosphaeria variabile TaxID=1932322 RepID=A0A9W8XR55_9PLEO|nr:Protein transport protein S9 plasma membrane t-SNARE [Didymosphaeria variabile]KAJ4356717.1 Protein transport protein S9 plasma membrane t-SNARE [Didymosphaeria variabile]